MMLSNPANSALPEDTDQKATERARKENSARAAELKLQRERDGAQAMKDHETARLETLAKTARLRAARLAREASLAAEPKPLPAKRSKARKA